MAGTIAEVPASPIPPGDSELLTMWTSIVGCLVHAHDLVGIEIGLLHTAVLDRDLAVERGRGAEDDSALDLCSTVSGLTAIPQSTAQTTRRTRTAPSFETSISATSAR